MSFELIKSDKKTNGRVGNLVTSHGVIETPVFMPVGTIGNVKAISHKDLTDIVNAQIILSNTYHLYLRPGIDVISKAGGIHKFMGWERPVLTDSGGYQVYSLAKKRKLTKDGAWFQSHIDGSKHFFSPENVIDIQRKIGADIIMAFDECTHYPCEYKYAKDSMGLTHSWLNRCYKQFNNNSAPYYNYDQFLFPIVQGSTYKDLRKESALEVASYDSEGYAIGGLSVGEPHDIMYEMTDIVCSILPKTKPRYLMGVGTPANLLECISLGVDMFDCVMPTRNARNGMLFTEKGIINILNEKWKYDYSEIDKNGNSYVDKNYSKAYLRHLFVSKEILGPMIATIHNLAFYVSLINKAREHIIEGDFSEWKTKISKQLSSRI